MYKSLSLARQCPSMAKAFPAVLAASPNKKVPSHEGAAEAAELVAANVTAGAKMLTNVNPTTNESILKRTDFVAMFFPTDRDVFIQFHGQGSLFNTKYDLL
jgi:hypothetical protein